MKSADCVQVMKIVALLSMAFITTMASLRLQQSTTGPQKPWQRPGCHRLGTVSSFIPTSLYQYRSADSSVIHIKHF